MIHLYEDYSDNDDPMDIYIKQQRSIRFELDRHSHMPIPEDNSLYSEVRRKIKVEHKIKDYIHKLNVLDSLTGRGGKWEYTGDDGKYIHILLKVDALDLPNYVDLLSMKNTEIR